MIIIGQDRNFIINNPIQIDYVDGIIGCFKSNGDSAIIGVYEIESTPIVFEKIIEAYKNGEKVFEMPRTF